ncbi:hypothetical protein BX600DRAFT_436950 [Xylariales sp. PMI_506]|nr:hypothetical protein BX600DRAFT_436950 [Xylariales sp. PMI_506]
MDEKEGEEEKMQKMNGLSYVEGDPIAVDYTYPTCQQRFIEALSLYPDNTALVSMYQGPTLYSIPSQPLDTPEYAQNPYLRWTYRNLKLGINRLASGLRAKGVKSGTLVVTLLPNSVEHVLMMAAAQLLDCFYAPLDPRQMANKDEISYLLSLMHDGVSGGQVVVIVRDLEIASLLDKLQHDALREAIKIVCDSTSNSGSPGWHTLSHIMADDNPPDAFEPGAPDTPSGHLILCTSGTTSAPKAVMLSVHQTGYLIYGITLHDRTRGSSSDVVLAISPHNHIAGWFSVQYALLYGGTLVLTSPTFGVEAITKAVVAERVTYSNFSPTVIRMLAASGCSGLFSGLRNLGLGSAIVTPDVLDIATKQLGAQKVSIGYGATEGSIVRTGGCDPHELVSGNDVAVTLMPDVGMAIKVCREGSNSDILPWGEAGELHISSPATCRGYIGLENTGSFYQDSGGRWWQNMGDMARLEPGGRLFVTGRYKDIINRGGEKISPAAVEAVLAQEPAFRHLDVQVVGMPDHVAGEVPVALTKTAISEQAASAIRETIVRHMGPACAPEEIIPLESLGLNDYPRTATGKVQKVKLVALVRDYYQQRKEAVDESDSTVETLKVIWSRALGLDPNSLSSDTRVADYADSISFMRVRDRISKAIGKTLSLKELFSAATIGDEARLLDSKELNTQNGQSWHYATNKRDGPPGVEDMIHLTETPELFETTKKVIEEALQKVDPTLKWDDVQEVMPAYDFIRISFNNGLMNHMNIKVPWLTKGVSVEALRAALELLFQNNPVMASFIVGDEVLIPDVAMLVFAKQSPRVMSHIIVDSGTLKTAEDLQKFANSQNYPECLDAVPPAPLTKISIFFIEETQSAGLVLNGNHVVYDVTFVGLILEDLEALLGGQLQLQPHQNYKLWSDVTYSLRESPAARAAVKYFAETRRGLEKHKHGFWPSHPPVYMPRDIQIAADGVEGLTHGFEIPGLPVLRMSHPTVAPAMVLKAALVLFLRHKSGHSHAIFSQVEADRLRWPFLPGALGEHSASDVGGQTIQSCLNVVAPGEHDTVIGFLKNLQSDQILQTKHAAAPRLLVMNALGEDARLLVPWIGAMTVFNWIGHPAASAPLQHLKALAVRVSPKVFGFFMMCGMKGSQGMWIRLRGATFGLMELRQFVRELELLAQWLVKEDNWERKISESEEVWV